MKNINDLVYIQRVKAGDVQAFAMIVSKYQKMVFTIVMKIVKNREDAEDVAQEIFIKAFKSLKQFKENAEFSTWLYRVAYNTTLSELRKRKYEFTSLEENLKTVNDFFADNKEDEEIELQLQYLDQVMKELPPNEIFLLTLHYINNQSIENIAKIVNLSASNVKVKLYRIRKKLALELNHIMQDENK
jgi:RNA polymerase sigma-70 factor (ECF subfamily)